MTRNEQLHQPRVLALILAGGKGERLMPLTQARSKPAVPFGGTYRIVDFVLSNFLQLGPHGHACHGAVPLAILNRAFAESLANR